MPLRLGSLLLLLLALAATARGETKLPQKMPRQWVVDDAKILAVHEVTALEHRVAAIERELQVKVVIVTVATLEREPASVFAGRVELFWKPGRRSVILLVVGGDPRRGAASARPEFHVEPNDELRQALRPTALQTLCLQKVAPRFAMSDRKGGLMAGLDGIADLVRLHAPPKDPRRIALDPSLPLEPLAPIASSSGTGDGAAIEGRAGISPWLAIGAPMGVTVVLLAGWWLAKRAR